MPSWLGTTELIIVLVIVLLLFGAGRIGKIAREFGEGVKSFKRELAKGDQSEVTEKE
jgi:sec-independent protein translocase protein TatA